MSGDDNSAHVTSVVADSTSYSFRDRSKVVACETVGSISDFASAQPIIRFCGTQPTLLILGLETPLWQLAGVSTRQRNYRSLMSALDELAAHRAFADLSGDTFPKCLRYDLPLSHAVLLTLF